ncbi:hypothetical protein P7K49_003006 [Saguinus oedipus]|uniref:Uncharacterized protein n=1 Tax=Saguinus oedipus TaxID=9490 RepID=A0ABQ9WJG3_SAGOE|nr:hypothetical protein P7K49_003006 [Saguinus oedipus]
MNNAVTQRGTVTTGGQQQGWALFGWPRQELGCKKEARVVQQQLSPCLSAAQLHTLQLRSTSPKPPCGIPQQHQCTNCLSVFS